MYLGIVIASYLCIWVWGCEVTLVLDIFMSSIFFVFVSVLESSCSSAWSLDYLLYSSFGILICFFTHVLERRVPLNLPLVCQFTFCAQAL